MATDFKQTSLGLVVLLDIELASGTLRYATEDVPFVGGNFYEGRLAGVQGITEELSTLLRPLQRQGTLTLILDNITAAGASGFFDSSIDGGSNFWPNTSVTVRAGEGTTFADYSTIFQGRIRLKDGIHRTLDTLELVIEDRRARELATPFPFRIFDTTTYPNLEDGGAGRRIPWLYGDWSSVWVGPLTCTDKDLFEFKIADHPLYSITQVGKDPGDGTGIANVSHTNEDLPAATFRITAYDPETDKVYVKCKGRLRSGLTLMENPAHVLEDLILETVVGPRQNNADDSLKLLLLSNQIPGITDGGALATWPDLSGHDFDATQGTGANRPTTPDNQQNTLPAADFDGINDRLDFSGAALDIFTDIGAASVTVVVASDTSSLFRSVSFSQGTSSNLSRIIVERGRDANKRDAGGRRLDTDAYQYVSGGTYILGAPGIDTALFDWANADIVLFGDGVELASNLSWQTAGTTSATTSLLGRIGASGFPSEFLNGQLYAVLARLGIAHRVADEQYLNHLFRLSASGVTDLIDEAAFDQLADDLSDLAVRWYITEERTAEHYISRLANEVGVDLRIAANLYTPTWFVPGFPGTADAYEERVNIAADSFKLSVDPNQEYVNEIQYAYAYDPRTKNFSKSGVVTDSAAVTEAGHTEARSVQFTAIADDADAETLAQRLLLLFRGPPEMVSFVTPDFDVAVGDLISVTAGTQSLLLANARKTKKEFRTRSVEVSALTVRSAGRIGRYVADDYPNYAAATQLQRQQGGFYTDDSGRASPGDAASEVSHYW